MINHHLPDRVLVLRVELSLVTGRTEVVLPLKFVHGRERLGSSGSSGSSSVDFLSKRPTAGLHKGGRCKIVTHGNGLLFRGKEDVSERQVSVLDSFDLS